MAIPWTTSAIARSSKIWYHSTFNRSLVLGGRVFFGVPKAQPRTKHRILSKTIEAKVRNSLHAKHSTMAVTTSNYATTSSICTLRQTVRSLLALALVGATAAAGADDARISLRSMRSGSPLRLDSESMGFTSPAQSSLRTAGHYPSCSGRSSQWAFKLSADDIPRSASLQALRVHV